MRSAKYFTAAALVLGLAGTASAQGTQAATTQPTTYGETVSHWVASGFVGGGFNASSSNDDPRIQENGGGVSFGKSVGSMPDFFYNTLSPWQWGLLALVPPAILALYFLKLKRQPLEVPSTYLWKRSIEDMHVNSLWQRLRQNLLLFLQLLLVALAMLALLRPGWQSAKLDGERFIFLVDNSASMSATDIDGAKNRLDEAKKLVGGLIDQMDSGMTAMLVSFADTPQVVQEFTNNRRLLRERLESIEPTVRGTDLRGALELADGLANPSRMPIQEGDKEIDVVEAQKEIFSLERPALVEGVLDSAADDPARLCLGS